MTRRYLRTATSCSRLAGRWPARLTTSVLPCLSGKELEEGLNLESGNDVSMMNSSAIHTHIQTSTSPPLPQNRRHTSHQTSHQHQRRAPKIQHPPPLQQLSRLTVILPGLLPRLRHQLLVRRLHESECVGHDTRDQYPCSSIQSPRIRGTEYGRRRRCVRVSQIIACSDGEEGKYDLPSLARNPKHTALVIAMGGAVAIPMSYVRFQTLAARGAGSSRRVGIETYDMAPMRPDAKHEGLSLRGVRLG